MVGSGFIQRLRQPLDVATEVLYFYRRWRCDDMQGDFVHFWKFIPHTPLMYDQVLSRTNADANTGTANSIRRLQLMLPLSLCLPMREGIEIIYRLFCPQLPNS